uniref:Uncharacterized protein n=1 Tax=Pseudomonas phage Cygsa01 TaxID=3138529 RepID=A0AAU6W3D8_9VIRU
MAQKTVTFETVRKDNHWDKQRYRVTVTEVKPSPAGKGEWAQIVDLAEAYDLDTLAEWAANQDFPDDTIIKHVPLSEEDSYDTVEARRAWYILNFGSVRRWAMWSVATNWRIRRRLPRITKAAVAADLMFTQEGV